MCLKEKIKIINKCLKVGGKIMKRFYIPDKSINCYLLLKNTERFSYVII